jgi:uncharacterized protein (TIGR02001 family)
MSIIRSASLGAASLLAAAMFAGPALADGMPSRGKIKGPAPEARPCTLSANVGVTSDYVFRGTSQSAEDPAFQGGLDATCGMFYAGVWASSIEFGTDASTEIDLYAGLKKTIGRFSFDVGLIYYAYPGASNVIAPNGADGQLDFFEIKAGASTEVWKDGTLGATVFYSPDYQIESGDVWTVEGSFSQALPKVGMFSPTFSALVGYQTGDSSTWRAAFANGDNSFIYWNAGVTFGFLEKWSLDLRYWDTDISNAGGFCTGDVLQCDGRFLATLKFTY